MIGGRRYRVSATADAERLHHLARIVDAKLLALPQLQRTHPDALVLVSLALAHELEEQLQAHQTMSEQYALRLTQLLTKIDAALGTVDENGEPLARVDPATTKGAGRNDLSPESVDAQSQQGARSRAY